MQNLLQWGQKGDINSLQQFAEQFFNQRGRNFNQEMQGLMDSIKKS
jgi:hypothetical protein